MKVRDIIVDKLTAALEPFHIDVINESHQHNVPESSETHFKVICASGSFDGLNRVKRHQRVYALLASELAGGVHALALHLYSPSEWNKVDAAPDSPKCMGGSKR